MSEHQRSGNLADASHGRVKLMCSYGGKILLRPYDNELRYVGGETRVLFIARNIRYVDLMSRFTRFYGSALVFKYQLPGEDLDALVSVFNDEDLEIMIEEFDRLHSKKSFSRIRSFLFTLKESSFPKFLEEARDPEQRFLDAINGILPSVSRRHMTLFASHAQGTDFPSEMGGLANQGRNSCSLHGKPFCSLPTWPSLQNSAAGKETANRLHSIASSERVASLYEPQKSAKQQVIVMATSAKENLVSCPSVATAQSHSLVFYNNIQSSSRRINVPLVKEISAQGQLPEGIMRTQCSVEDNLPISSSVSPRVKPGILDDLSDMSEQSLEEQLDAYACNLKDVRRLAEKEEIFSGFNKNVRNFDSAINSSGLRRFPSNDELLDLFHKKNDDGRCCAHASAGSNANLCLRPEQRLTEHIIDHRNLIKTRDYKKSESKGEKMAMQRIASDPMLSSEHVRQTMHASVSSSNRTSGAPVRWQTGDDLRQQHHEGDGALPRHMVFLPQPHLPARRMHRVSSAPNITKAGADCLPPRYVAAPPAPASIRQQHDEQSALFQHLPPTMRSSSYSIHRSPSRLREPSAFS